MDPISAIANAAGSMFNMVGGIFQAGAAKTVAKEQTKQTVQMTEQERERYDQLIASGNTQLASQLLQQVNSRVSANNTVTYLLVGGLILTVIIIIIFKNKKV